MKTIFNKKIIIFLLSILCALTLALGVGSISVNAEEEKSLRITACNLNFMESAKIMYAVDGENIKDLENVKLLIWTAPSKTYLKGSENYALSMKLKEDVLGKDCAIFINENVGAKEMTDDFYARPYYKDNETEIYGGMLKYSVIQYAKNMKGSERSNEKLDNLIDGLLNYGALSQIYFDYKTDRLADETYFQLSVNGGILYDGTQSGLYHSGEQVSVSSSLDNFAGWIDNDNNLLSDQNPYSLYLTKDTVITAVDSEKLSYINAEKSLKQRADKIIPIFSADTCLHDNISVLEESGHDCFICNDCGLFGVDFKSETTTYPTTGKTGIMKYTYSKGGIKGEFTKVIPKVVTSDWYWAFYNDQNKDGMPEFNSYTYTDLTTTKYSYLYKRADFPDFKEFDPTEYGGISDEELAAGKSELTAERTALTTAWREKLAGIKEKYGETYKESEEYITEIAAHREKLLAINAKITALNDINNDAKAAYNTAKNEYEQSLYKIISHKINEDTSVEITEEQKLYYFFHKPFDYDENKSYPILVFYPGSGGVLMSYSYYGGTNAIPEDSFYYDKYRQTLGNVGSGAISSSKIDFYGNWKEGQMTILDASWCGSFFVNWYNQIKNPGVGRDKYDCFVIFVQPADSYWFSTGSYISMSNQVNVDEIEGAFKITSDMTGDTSYTGYSRPVYDSSYVSASPDGQLACKLIDNLAKEFNIDLSRQYVAGGSLGGAFTMDMINHYHDRFACAIPVVPATADITEKTAREIVKSGINVWAISGDGDTNCNKYFSKLFVDGLNKAKSDLEITDDYVYQFSFFPGGHSCAYIGGDSRTAKQGVSITYSTQVLDFMFNSVKD